MGAFKCQIGEGRIDIHFLLAYEIPQILLNYKGIIVLFRRKTFLFNKISQKIAKKL